MDAYTRCAYLFMLESAPGPQPRRATLRFSLRAAKNPTANPESRFLARFLLPLYCAGGRRDVPLPSRPDLPLKRQQFFLFIFLFSVCVFGAGDGEAASSQCNEAGGEEKKRFPPTSRSFSRFLILDSSGAEPHG